MKGFFICKALEQDMNRIKWRKFFYIYCVLGVILNGCGKPSIGVKDGRLMPCPGSPNCVSSYETHASHYTEPLNYSGSLANARKEVLSILHAMPDAKVVVSQDDYIHAEFRSKIFRFVDDVEFYFAEASPIIHVRSASRLGYSDLGVNRERMEKIRKLFNEEMGIDAKGK
jgi:uncharacterized protein (DUF1499 family)